mgnify:CR=1 FL=1
MNAPAKHSADAVTVEEALNLSQIVTKLPLSQCAIRC